MFLTRFFKYMTGPGSRGEQNRIKSLISMKRARQRPGLVILGCTLTALVAFQTTLIIHLLRGPQVSITADERDDYTKRLDYFKDRKYKWLNLAGRDFKTAYKGPDYKSDESN